MRCKPPRRARPRIRPARRIALAAVSSLAAASMALSGNAALAQTPKPTPPDEHTTTPATPTPTQPSGETTHTVVPGDTLWGIAQGSLGSGALWPAIYDANESAIEKTARTHGHKSSRHGGLIFPGIPLRVRDTREGGAGLFSSLTPQQQQGVSCMIDVLLLAKTGGTASALRSAVDKDAAGQTLSTAERRAFTAAEKLLDVVQGCGSLFSDAEGLVGILRDAATTDSPLVQALNDALTRFGGLQCAKSISAALRAVQTSSFANSSAKGLEAVDSVLNDCGDTVNGYTEALSNGQYLTVP